MPPLELDPVTVMMPKWAPTLLMMRPSRWPLISATSGLSPTRSIGSMISRPCHIAMMNGPGTGGSGRSILPVQVTNWK